jgi:hypothetical protein
MTVNEDSEACWMMSWTAAIRRSRSSLTLRITSPISEPQNCKEAAKQILRLMQQNSAAESRAPSLVVTLLKPKRNHGPKLFS